METTYLTRAADGLDRRGFSVEDVDRMVEAGVLEARGRWELLDGEIVPMNAQYTPHGRMALGLAVRLVNALKDARFEVLQGVTVQLSQWTRVDPDIFVVRAGITANIVSPADVLWVIEVADSTRWRDLKVKAPLYAKAGVPELWVVDLESRVTHIHRGPGQGGWARIETRAFEDEAAAEAFADLRLRLADFAP